MVPARTRMFRAGTPARKGIIKVLITCSRLRSPMLWVLPSFQALVTDVEYLKSLLKWVNVLSREKQEFITVYKKIGDGLYLSENFPE